MSRITYLSSPLGMLKTGPVIHCEECGKKIENLEDGIVAVMDQDEIRITHRAEFPRGHSWMPLEYYLLKLFLASDMAEIEYGEEGTVVTITRDVSAYFFGG